jgi:hypothetical protein
MTEIITDFVAELVKQGPLVVALAIAIYYLKRSDDQKAGAIASLIALMNAERTERIGILEKHVDECNRQHAACQQEHKHLLLKVARIENHH